MKCRAVSKYKGTGAAEENFYRRREFYFFAFIELNLIPHNYLQNLSKNQELLDTINSIVNASLTFCKEGAYSQKGGGVALLGRGHLLHN